MFLANIYQLNTYLNIVSRQDYKLQDYMTWVRPKASTDAIGVYFGCYEELTPTNSFATALDVSIIKLDGIILNYLNIKA